MFACFSVAMTLSASWLRLLPDSAPRSARRGSGPCVPPGPVLLDDGIVADAIGIARSRADVRRRRLLELDDDDACRLRSRRPSAGRCVPIVAAPARMMSGDSAIACQRQRTKSKLGLVKICMMS